MTDIIDFFKTKIEEANLGNKCGRCWVFVPGRKDYTNLIRKEDDDLCCTYFLLEKESSNCIYSSDRDSFSTYLISEDIKFEAFIGVDADFTRQFYTEVESDKTLESKYDLYLKDLYGCIKELMDDNFCSTIFPAGFKTIYAERKINYKDQNLDGFFVKGTITRWYE